MILAPLAALVAAGSAFAPCPAAECGPAALDEHARVVLRIEEMHASIENRSHAPVLIALGNQGREASRFLWLPAGARLDQTFPRGARGLEIEVVQQGEAGWTSSGALRFEPEQAGPLESALLPDGSAHAMQDGRGIAPAGTQSILPSRAFRLLSLPSGGTSGSLPESDGSPLHVPVPQPSNRPSGDKPPKLEEKPLPPV